MDRAFRLRRTNHTTNKDLHPMGKSTKSSSRQPVSSRRSFLQTTLIGGTAATLTSIYAAGEAARVASPKPAATIAPKAADVKEFELAEITIPELQDGMKSVKFTAHALAEKYLARIDELDKRGPAVNAIIELNPDALSIADTLDQ